MRDIFSQLRQWRERGEPLALATVVKTWGSAPRPEGAKMAVNAHGEFCGSVSGGCVEAAVLEAAQQVLATGAPQLLRFGVADEQAWSVGLTCGGSIAVFVQPWPARPASSPPAHENDFTDRLLQQLAQPEPFVLATVIKDQALSLGQRLLLDSTGVLHNEFTREDLTQAVAARAAALLSREQAEIAAAGESEIFMESIFPAPRLILIGAVHLAIPLVTLAQTLDFEVILVDPRSAFATAERFPRVDRLLRQWPDEALHNLGIDASTAIVILTHDAKLDDPALKFALQYQPAYLGILGSKRTHEKRIKRLKEEGVSDEQLARVHAPVGLDLGARTPAEIAISIMADIVAQRRRAA